MKFESVEIQHAVGKILAHNLSDGVGKRRIRKGTVLSDEHVALLGEIGIKRVYVAELEDGDVPEEQAAPLIAASLAGDDIELQGAATGRTNLLATHHGILFVDQGRLDAINRIKGITVATLPQHRVVTPRGVVASVKIIPYGLPAAAVEEVERICADAEPILSLLSLQGVDVALLLTGRPGLEPRLRRDFGPPLVERIEALGSNFSTVAFFSTDSEDILEQLAGMLADEVRRKRGLILVAGETAIMDTRDILPQALLKAGGEIESLGAPVDPGNLLMLGYLEDVPVVGTPGCARSRKENVVDWVLPRLLAGDRLTCEDIVSMGVGGLLVDEEDKSRRR